jgi:hypothetical protein
MPHFFRLGCRTAPSKEKKQIGLFFSFFDYTETMINISIYLLRNSLNGKNDLLIKIAPFNQKV